MTESFQEMTTQLIGRENIVNNNFINFKEEMQLISRNQNIVF